MSKLKNVTQTELDAAISRADELSGVFFSIINRSERGCADEFSDPLSAARTLNVLVIQAAEMVTHLMVKHEIQQMKRQEELLRQQKGSGA